MQAASLSLLVLVVGVTLMKLSELDAWFHRRAQKLARRRNRVAAQIVLLVLIASGGLFNYAADILIGLVAILYTLHDGMHE